MTLINKDVARYYDYINKLSSMEEDDTDFLQECHIEYGYVLALSKVPSCERIELLV